MKRNPRSLFWFIALLTLVAIFFNSPTINNLHLPFGKKISIGPAYLLQRLNITTPLVFREGLDLQGGVSLTFRADTKNIPEAERASALESAKTLIEKRVNLFGVSEPIVQTATVNGEDRILAEVPGITDVNQAINLIGTTAQLTFWEQGATPGAQPKQTNLTGSDISNTSVTFDPNNGNPEVQLNFTPAGTKKFADITTRNVGKPVAIVLDNSLISNPVVNQAIVNGSAVISGNFTQDQANQLSTELNAGALPIPLTVIEQHVVAPTLGVEPLHKSLIAGIIGLVTIVIFMIVLYGRLGVIASVALLLYTLFVLTIFKLSSITPYGVTLTLAGIAGFILSIGMAVDANILIFERIREELRANKSRETAIELGFSKAWTSIRDSNVSTLITCLILYEFGTGIIKGFALVLAIGVLVSMFSAIVVTRTFLRVFSRK